MKVLGIPALEIRSSWLVDGEGCVTCAFDSRSHTTSDDDRHGAQGDPATPLADPGHETAPVVDLRGGKP